MPVPELPSNPKVTLIFKGLFVSYITDGSNSALVKLLNYEYATDHKRTITIRRNNTVVLGPLNITNDINFNIVNPHLSGIHVLHQAANINRTSAEYVQDFRWVTDLRREIFHHIPSVGTNVRIIDDHFLRVISINHGVFYTKELSRESVNIIKPQVADAAFGFLAESIGVAIDLRQAADSKLIMTWEGVSREIRGDDGTATDTYEIEIDRSCNIDFPPGCINDFDKLYNHVNPPIQAPNRVLLRERSQQTPGNDVAVPPEAPTESPVGPEVPCIFGNIG